MRRRLEKRWLSLCQRIGATHNAGAIGRKLLARYAEPQRFYHGLTHLRDGLDVFDRFRRLAHLPDAVEVAWWFHDAIYDTRGADNEERSAAYAVESLEVAGVSRRLARKVSKLILATKHTGLPVGVDACLLVDVDLSILGQSTRQFCRYETQIRREYAWVPRPQFNDARATILRSFLKRPKIYSTRPFQRIYEMPARRNLEWSLERLGRPKKGSKSSA